MVFAFVMRFRTQVYLIAVPVIAEEEHLAGVSD